MNFIVGQDELIREVTSRTINDNGKRITLKRPSQHLVPLEVWEENEPPDKTSDNNNINDGNTINVNTEKELWKSRRDAMNANLIQGLNKDHCVLILWN